MNEPADFEVVVPFPSDLTDDEAAGIKDIAIREWQASLAERGGVPADGTLHVARMDSPEVDGELLGIGYTDDDGIERKAPPISAWHVWGQAIRP